MTSTTNTIPQSDKIKKTKSDKIKSVSKSDKIKKTKTKSDKIKSNKIKSNKIKSDSKPKNNKSNPDIKNDKVAYEKKYSDFFNNPKFDRELYEMGQENERLIFSFYNDKCGLKARQIEHPAAPIDGIEKKYKAFVEVKSYNALPGQYPGLWVGVNKIEEYLKMKKENSKYNQLVINFVFSDNSCYFHIYDENYDYEEVGWKRPGYNNKKDHISIPFNKLILLRKKQLIDSLRNNTVVVL